jgi:DNA topoisomerase-1
VSTPNVVVVESPAKAKTIEKYLGKDYKVLASFGHVRDLPPKDGSVDPEHDFAMLWELSDGSRKPVTEITNALKGASTLYLATDPDREGEAISWHIAEILKEKKLDRKLAVKRVTFNEITQRAVKEAFSRPREVDAPLVEAYLARRALDYLVGFTLSPVLWRKLPGSRSAGRVQSVALRLICEREAEIEAFRPQEYWTVEAQLATPKDQRFTARLTRLGKDKLDKFSLGNEAKAMQATEAVKKAALAVQSVERKTVKRNPFAPFITSSLQMEASRKLGFGATKTMRIAQQLYEGIALNGETVGLITYMRTDGVSLSNEAIAQARQVIGSEFGEAYVPPSPRVYKSKAKNAQEAHEAIRPTDLSRLPSAMNRFLNGDQAALYDLIWKRTVASQMTSAEYDQVAVDIGDKANTVGLRANGSVLTFDGFLKVYEEGRDEPSADPELGNRLPAMSEGDALKTFGITPEQHFTEPPPRYSEATLVKRLEELGIGRPSTYASILQVLQDRNYVRLNAKRFEPEDRGRLVTAFLTSFFGRYVEYGFTAALEAQLDEISDGKADWKQVLRDFWKSFIGAVDETKGLSIGQVIEALDGDLGAHFFPTRGDGSNPRACPSCSDGRLGLKLGKFGAFIGCSNYPGCNYTRPLVVAAAGDDAAQAGDTGPRLLGNDPETGLPVSVRRGPYGLYVQLGPAEGAVEATEETAKGKKAKSAEKPKRVSLPKTENAAEITLDRALLWLSLPRLVGTHPDTQTEILAGIGRFGPYLKHDGRFKSIPKDEDVLYIGLNRAVDLLASAPGGGGKGRAAPSIALGEHPSGGPITVHGGRYGTYVKHGKVNATIKDTTPEAVTMEQAIAAIASRAPKGKTGKIKAAPVKAKAAAPKKAAAAAPKKTPAKKAAAKKPAAAKRKAAG